MSELRRVRVNKNLSIIELAARAEVSPEQVRNIENGRTLNPRAETLNKLARILRVKAAEIDPMQESDRRVVA